MKYLYVGTTSFLSCLSAIVFMTNPENEAAKFVFVASCMAWFGIWCYEVLMND